jgi:hypothetical protein
MSAGRARHVGPALALVAALTAGLAAAQGPAPLTAAAYRAELDRLIVATAGIDLRRGDIPHLVDSVPNSWRVEVGGRRFDVPADWLRRELGAVAGRPDRRAAARIGDRLRRLRAELDAYEAPPRVFRDERARAAEILAAAEFAGVHGPTWFDRLRQRALGWLIGLVDRLLGSSTIPAIGRVAVTLLVILAIAALAIFVYRGFRRSARVESVLPDELPVSARPWTEWLAAARAAADEGRWQDAVRLAYWTAISFLESARVWPPDRARTPREYLRLLGPASEHRPALAALTGTFELAWYAGREADADTYSKAVGELERLGCRSR